MKKVLVLCTGNVCRSPTAEFLLRQKCGEDVIVQSAGIGALIDSPAETLAQKVAKEHGLDISTHRSRQVTMDMLKWADLVLVMERGQEEWLLSRYPWLKGKIFRQEDDTFKFTVVEDKSGKLPAIQFDLINRGTPVKILGK